MKSAGTAFKLDESVVQFPASALSERERLATGSEEEDVVITNPRGRSGSIIVQQRTVDLMEGFRQPRTIVESVMHYASSRDLDPMKVLESVFPTLEHLVRKGFLVPAGGNAEPDRIASPDKSLDFGDGVEIGCLIQELPDVSVFQGRLNGTTVAIKVCSEDDPLAESAIINESSLLAASTSATTPTMLRTGRSGNRPYLITEWVSGVPCTVVAQELRGRGALASRRSLLDLAVSIADAYANLHDSGLLHGDVHPGNTLVDSAGRVRLIDLGLGMLVKPDLRDRRSPGRGGTGFYYEPELAVAKANGFPLPELSVHGEVFSVAALLYLLLTGDYYKAFPLDEHQLYTEVARGGMRPFEAANAPSWPEVEHVLQRALHVQPLERHSTMRALATELRAVRTANPLPRPKPTRSDTSRALVSDFLRVMTERPPSIGIDPPTSSLNFGAGGGAYFLYRVACLTDEPRHLAAADLWLGGALADTSTEAFYNDAIDVTRATVGEGSVFHSVVGLHALGALIAGAMGNVYGASESTELFIDTARTRPCVGPDLALGRAGQLNAAAIMVTEARMRTGKADSQLLAFGRQLYQDLDKFLRRPTPIAVDTDIDYLGLAHGWAGLLFACLHWCRATSSDVSDTVTQRLSELAGLGEPAGRGIRWPIRNRTVEEDTSSTSYMAGWCNGSAGFVHLYLLAHELTRDEEYLRIATLAGWNAWESAKLGNFSLCCGTAGRSYALLALHSHGCGIEWLDRAHVLAENAVSLAQRSTLLQSSLYKGSLGVALLAAEIAEPSLAAMPFVSS